MKVKLLLDGGTPKVPPNELGKLVRDSGLQLDGNKPDFGIVVGGDGVFSRYGRTEDIPLLLVGVRKRGAAGSKAHLAQTTYDALPDALAKIKGGRYSVVEHRRLGVLKNGRSLGEVFTDVYLQRGSDGGCIRYRLQVSGHGVAIEEAAIADGVIVTTPAGASGYYSYPDRIKGDDMDPDAFASLEKDQVGICHVNPTFTERRGMAEHPLRYAVPWGSKVTLSLFRKADARLYGTTDRRSGVRIRQGDKVTVVPGKKPTRLITL